MKGKFVNLCIGSMNVFVGILFLVFTLYIPQDKTRLTIQESLVVNYIKLAINVVVIATFIVNLIQVTNYRRTPEFNKTYIISLLAIIFIFLKEPILAAFPIASGIMIIFKSLKENLVEIDNTTAISIVALIITAIVIIIGVSLLYDNIGENIKNRENKNETEYKSDYFKYIIELGIEDVYINVKVNGKYGYINERGELVMDFIYDYASPFVPITMYNKRFDIALVCKDGSSQIILKNGRKVMSYRTESNNENYKAKEEELKNIYTNVLNQTEEFKYEYVDKNESMIRANVYKEISSDYTFRYDYNEEYDLIVTQSNLGLGDKYELAKKDDINIRIELPATNLDYDSNYLYLFSNGTIPFYSTEAKSQGWFTNYGKKEAMEGRAQILDFVDDKILIRDYNKRYNSEAGVIYFIDNETKSNILSEKYKDIYLTDNKYIVKNMENRYQVLNKDFQKAFEQEYDFIDTSLAHKNLYIVMNTNEGIDFNDYNFAKMKLKLLNENGEVILDNIEQIYGNYYTISNDKSKAFVDRYNEFLGQIKKIEYNFVGDKFYLKYINN